MALACSFKDICSGCQYLDFEYPRQQEMKSTALATALAGLDLDAPKNSYVAVAEYGLRDRMDAQIQDGRIGFFSKTSKQIVDIDRCLQLSPELQNWFQDFRAIQIPIRQGSFRLRVSPEGLRGVWLDFANLDIKALLEEQTTLRALMKQAVVEIGQKRKILSEIEGQLKLVDPIFYPWTRTWINESPVNLYSSVGSFSQVGHLANQKLVARVQTLLDRSSAKKIIELGCGNGNLSYVAAANGRQVDAFEIEALALLGLQKSLQETPANIRAQKMDFQNKNFWSQLSENGDLLLANPPRSGLGSHLLSAKLPPQIVYMSCHLDSFSRDCADLSKLGFKIRSLEIIDQFPQTAHFEILALLDQGTP